MNRALLAAVAAASIAACGGGGTASTESTPAPAPAPPDSTAAPTPEPAPADAGPAYILTAEECRAAAGRGYALMQRWNPAKLTATQKQRVDDYTAQMEGASLEACRTNSREWYECKMAASEHFEAEDCNMIGADADDADEMP